MSAAGPRERVVDSSVRGLQRLLADVVPGGRATLAPSEGPSLEVMDRAVDPPRLIAAAVIEGNTVRARPVNGVVQAEFTGFLDGTQSSQVLHHVDGVPIIRGVVGAVIRLRRNRRMSTWRQASVTKVFAPLALLSSTWRRALELLPVQVVDTMVNEEGASVIEHPYAVREAAVHFVQRERERLEQQLGVEWCGEMRERLFVDGGISGNERVATEDCVVGVVKTHRTLYAEGDALRTILRLKLGERSSALRVTSPKRTVVASWYLRMRDPAGHDPMWGLVRVEVAHRAGESQASIAERADEVSRWILAEVTPVALPDARWDKMVYGIRDCEEFLRAIS